MTWAVLPFDSEPQGWKCAAVSKTGARLVAAVGGGRDAGFLKTSNDMGTSWSTHLEAGAQNWWSVASSADGSFLAAVANFGYLYLSYDSGSTWMPNMRLGLQYWASVSMSADAAVMVAVVENGRLYLSSDFGRSWSNRNVLGTQSWRATQVAPDGGTIVAAAHKGFIYISENGGSNWTIQVSSPFPSPFSLALLIILFFQDKAGIRNWAAVAVSTGGGFILAAESDGDLHLSRDHGLSWTTLQIDLDQPFLPAPVDQKVRDTFVSNPLHQVMDLVAHKVREVMLQLTSTRAASSCHYPYTGQVCSKVHLGISLSSQLLNSISLSFLLVVVLCLRTVRGALVFTILVGLHQATATCDVLYILTAEFSNQHIFMITIAVFLSQFLFYSYRLVNSRRYMKFWVVEVPRLLLFKQHDTLVKLLLGGLVYLVFLVINLPLIIPLYLIGLLLMTTKLFAIGELSNFWLFAWTGNDVYRSCEPVDPRLLNELIAFYSVLSVPLAALKVTNNWHVDTVPCPIADLSLNLSFACIVIGLWRLLYYKVYRQIQLVSLSIHRFDTNMGHFCLVLLFH